jgi:WD40 repeat protein
MKRTAVCVSTSNPGTILASSGALTTLCPRTGAVLSTLRVVSGDQPAAEYGGGLQASNKAIGISAVSPFPGNLPLAIAHGSNVSNPQDSYGMLLSIRGHSAASRVHWKCRLPEPSPDFLLTVSPCGHYVVGGGPSGTLYAWKSLEGRLLNSFRGHYRAVTVLEWCHGFLLTGGADGMVHAFALSQVVQFGSHGSGESSSAGNRMIRTWNQHHVTVTAIAPLSIGRFASAAQDGRVNLCEMCSGAVLATFSFGAAITCMEHSGSDHCLLLGARDGIVHIVDLDEYAVQQSMQLGAASVSNGAISLPQSKGERVFGASAASLGVVGGDPTSSHPSFRRVLRGHDRAVTALRVVGEDLMMTGDESGCIRIWDLRSRVCTRVLQPWSTTSNAGAGLHPITSIRVLELSTDGDDDGLYKEWVQRLTPLQKYIETNLTTIPIFLRAKRSQECEAFWNSPTRILDVREALRRRKRRREENQRGEGASESVAERSTDQEGDSAETIRKLQEELTRAKSTIQRWEAVNNKILAQLQSQTG